MIMMKLSRKPNPMNGIALAINTANILIPIILIIFFKFFILDLKRYPKLILKDIYTLRVCNTLP